MSKVGAELQGSIHFTAAEEILQRWTEENAGTVVLDLSRVDRINDVARRMLLEGLRRFALEGRTPALRDPAAKLPEPDLGDGTLPELRD